MGLLRNRLAKVRRTSPPKHRLDMTLATTHVATEHPGVMMRHQAGKTEQCLLQHRRLTFALLALDLPLSFSCALHGKGVLVGLGDVRSSLGSALGA